MCTVGAHLSPWCTEHVLLLDLMYYILRRLYLDISGLFASNGSRSHCKIFGSHTTIILPRDARVMPFGRVHALTLPVVIMLAQRAGHVVRPPVLLGWHPASRTGLVELGHGRRRRHLGGQLLLRLLVYRIWRQGVYQQASNLGCHCRPV